MVASVWGDGVPDEAYEIPPASIISEQSGAYSILPSDAHRLLDYIGAGAATFTLPASANLTNGFVTNIRNSSAAGTLTIARVGSDTVEAAATLSLSPGTAVQLILKSTNFGLVFSRSIGASAINTTFAPAGTIIATNVQAAMEEMDAEKAALVGSSSQVFSVATATAAAHAMRKDQAEVAFATPAAIIAQTHNHFLTTGTSAAFILTPTLVQGAYALGQRFSVQFHLAAGTTPTINISGLGAKNLKWADGSGALVAITATVVPINHITDIVYDGTDFVVQDGIPALVAANATNATTSTTQAVGTNTTAIATTAYCNGAVGLGQTWQSPARAINTNYTNNTGKPIFISIMVNIPNTTSQTYLYCDSVAVARIDGAGGGTYHYTITSIIPPGSVYQLTTTTAVIDLWRELTT